ncbi:DinB family protein [Bacillus sp. KH172YL63]|uniref:DinB family protein n=1 Tax=Bacillus sp. KH172YL63 TaxID=2709784 RepID=UPI0013E41103|nr:DinB family protein [Bacillus sp. KH172YL63]BCB02579.1 hypothetical protein KH172YL63_07120 [Bacillus sp. KH172YL63]
MVDYRVKTDQGFTERIGELVWMLEHARGVTLEEVKGLKQVELDGRVDEDANTIGALLMHMAAIEYVHQVISFEGRDLTEAELGKWGPALALGEEGRRTIKHQPVEYYIDELAEVRDRTLSCLKQRNDQWLYEEGKWGNGVPYNHYYLWFHVMEDEISHRGQIRMLKRGLSSVE